VFKAVDCRLVEERNRVDTAVVPDPEMVSTGRWPGRIVEVLVCVFPGSNGQILHPV
jgi:hypothetical protein